MSGYQDPAGGTSSPSTGTAIGSKPIRAILRLFKGVDIENEAAYGTSFIPRLTSPFEILANKFRLYNPLLTFYTAFESAALTISQKIKIPQITTVEGGERKDEVVLLKQSQEVKNKGIDINPASTDENIIYDDDADTTHIATFDANGKLVKSTSVPSASLPSNVALKDASNDFTATQVTNKTAQASTAETVEQWKVSDDANSELVVENQSTTNGQFVPRIRSYQHNIGTLSAMYYTNEIPPAMDLVGGTVNIVTFNVRTKDITAGNALAAPTNRPLYGWQNNGFNKFQIWNTFVYSLIAHRFENYSDHKTITKPADPSTGYNRVYMKAIDANNDGWFTIIKKNGAYEEVQII